MPKFQLMLFQQVIFYGDTTGLPERPCMNSCIWASGGSQMPVSVQHHCVAANKYSSGCPWLQESANCHLVLHLHK